MLQVEKKSRNFDWSKRESVQSVIDSFSNIIGHDVNRVYYEEEMNEREFY